MASLETLVQEWLRLDRNGKTRREILDLLATSNTDELEKRMKPRIQFGTAGLRGKMEAGWARMNDLTVLQATQGLCAYVLLQTVDAKSRGVVIGYDHRHNSERWAYLAARVFLSHGVKTYLLQGLVHTPMVPFSVKRLSATCGIMITASHNPKQDNGYKVYWENAVQIIGPHDKGISDSIEANLEPAPLVEGDISSPHLEDRTAEMREAYFASLATLNTHRIINEKCKVKFVNTSMHGVSDRFVSRAFTLFGFPSYIPVVAQQTPDPEFPTVRFPNPEEKGALDEAIRVADAEGASYVLAQDPDGDRFAAAEKSPEGAWSLFTGDQLGALFAGHILDQYKLTGKPLNKLAMVASLVSSRMIEAMAIAEGFEFQDCLTGFKYIGNTALNLVAKGSEVPFGYEEAIGYMFGSEIRDKDGVAASVVFAQLVAQLHDQGRTARTFLEELYNRYGFFKTSNSYFICDDAKTIGLIFDNLRNFKGSASAYPSEIAGLRVTRVVDFATGYDSGNPPSYKSNLSSSGHMIQFRAGARDDLRIALTIRTSGTEPKIKYYLEGTGRDRDAVESILPQVVDELETIWLESQKYDLGRP